MYDDDVICLLLGKTGESGESGETGKTGKSGELKVKKDFVYDDG